MMNSETSSAVRVLVSFFLTPESGTVNDIKTTVRVYAVMSSFSKIDLSKCPLRLQ